MSLSERITTLIVTLALACQPGLAQYSGTPGTPGYTPPSNGYKANAGLIGGLAAGAVAGFGIWYYARHHNVYEGCVGSDGTSLIRQKDGKHFQLQGTSQLPAGEKVSLNATKLESDRSGSTLKVEKVRKDLGRCERETVAKE